VSLSWKFQNCGWPCLIFEMRRWAGEYFKSKGNFQTSDSYSIAGFERGLEL
jgi:hypothetical protein